MNTSKKEITLETITADLKNYIGIVTTYTDEEKAILSAREAMQKAGIPIPAAMPCPVGKSTMNVEKVNTLINLLSGMLPKKEGKKRNVWLEVFNSDARPELKEEEKAEAAKIRKSLPKNIKFESLTSHLSQAALNGKKSYQVEGGPLMDISDIRKYAVCKLAAKPASKKKEK